jgi:hypothetical protein
VDDPLVVGFITNFLKNNLDNNYTQGVVKLGRETFEANYHSSSSCVFFSSAPLLLMLIEHL